MVVLGVVQLGCGYAFYNMGVQKVSPQKASLLALWEMLLGPLWVAIFLQEYPSALVLIGFAVILVGMLLDALMPQLMKKQKH
jgi:drug/metabolite transporter (DMT)-like permease